MTDFWMPPIPLSDETDRSDIFRLLERPAWHKQAACRGTDPDLFFPERGEAVREAKRVCARCPVRDECLDWALTNHEKAGIWGGTSGRDRRTTKRRPAA